jgi:ATP-binding cassette subfamily F protein 2
MSDVEDYSDAPEETQEQTSKGPAKATVGARSKNGKALKGRAAKGAPAKAKPAPAKAKAAPEALSAAAIIAGASLSTDDSYRSCTGVLTSDRMARDVKISGVTLTSWSTELISDSSIELTIGRRYGLIGSNGCGKSTFLKALAHREVPIPDHIDIFFLENEAPASDLTGIQWIATEVKNAIAALEARAEALCEEFGPESLQLQQVYDDLGKLEEMNPETHAALLLHGLGFGPKMMAKATKDMSGGWRMRVALAKALFVRPTLLLLDEPTNHLDLEACVWLEDYLSTYDKCLVVVSHSQDFLNGVCTNIIEFNHKQQLVYWSGNYDQFQKTKAEHETNQLKKYEKEQDDIKHIKSFIASCGTFSNLVRQAKSKQKILDKMYEAGLTEKPVPPPVFNFRFAPCAKLAPPVLSFHNVGFAYSGKKEDMLYTGVDLAVDMDSRVALVGPNGAGKSTLLKLMVGELQATDGTIKRHLDLKFGRYHQHVTAELDEELTPLEFVARKFADLKYEEEQWRTVIGRYGISGKLQKMRIGAMSDGQKSRIVFCMLAIRNPNILLLDEPTNHLDMECIDSLAEAINAFEGGVVLVSHDFRLISQVAQTIWLCDGGVKTFQGSIRDYKTMLMKQVKENEDKFKGSMGTSK